MITLIMRSGVLVAIVPLCCVGRGRKGRAGRRKRKRKKRKGKMEEGEDGGMVERKDEGGSGRWEGGRGNKKRWRRRRRRMAK